MPKRNKFKLSNIKQGRTVYLLVRGLEFMPPKPHIHKMMVASDNVPLPPEGCIIEEPPAWFIKSRYMELKDDLFFSRRKAERSLKNLELMYMGIYNYG